MQIIALNEQETMKAAFEFANKLSPNDVVAFFGDLGSGKTTFCKGIAKALLIDEPVLSPTFTILKEYQGKFPLYHFDMYRISSEEELFDIGYYDYIESGGVCLIEWSENIREFLPDSYYSVCMELVDENVRKINIEKIKRD